MSATPHHVPASRSRFSGAVDILLLQEVAGTNPLEDGDRKRFITGTLNTATGKRKLHNPCSARKMQLILLGGNRREDRTSERSERAGGSEEIPLRFTFKTNQKEKKKNEK